MANGVTEERLSAVGLETKRIVDEAKNDLRREMRYLLVIGVAAGNTVAALVATKLSSPDPVSSAVAAVRSLTGF